MQSYVIPSLCKSSHTGRYNAALPDTHTDPGSRNTLHTASLDCSIPCKQSCAKDGTYCPISALDVTLPASMHDMLVTRMLAVLKQLVNPEVHAQRESVTETIAGTYSPFKALYVTLPASVRVFKLASVATFQPSTGLSL